MIPCDICGKQGHAWYGCPDRGTKPDDWRPDRLKKSAAPVVRQGGDKARAVRHLGPTTSQAKASKGKAERKRARKPDGDASRPSDTVEVSQGAPAKAASAAIPKRGRGRPRIVEDRRAYKAQKQREYRAKLKEAKPK